MATLYQLHSPMDTLRRCTVEMARTWRSGDSIILLGTTVAFIDWLKAYIDETDIEDIAAIYGLISDVTALGDNAVPALKLDGKLTALLTDSDWVALTCDPQFDKIVTIAL